MLCTIPAEILPSAAKQGRKGTGRSQKHEQQPNTDRPAPRSFMLREVRKTLFDSCSTLPCRWENQCWESVTPSRVFLHQFWEELGNQTQTCLQTQRAGSHPSPESWLWGKPTRLCRHGMTRGKSSLGPAKLLQGHYPAWWPTASAEHRDEQSLLASTDSEAKPNCPHFENALKQIHSVLE